MRRRKTESQIDLRRENLGHNRGVNSAVPGETNDINELPSGIAAILAQAEQSQPRLANLGITNSKFTYTNRSRFPAGSTTRVQGTRLGGVPSVGTSSPFYARSPLGRDSESSRTSRAPRFAGIHSQDYGFDSARSMTNSYGEYGNNPFYYADENYAASTAPGVQSQYRQSRNQRAETRQPRTRQSEQNGESTIESWLDYINETALQIKEQQGFSAGASYFLKEVLLEDLIKTLLIQNIILKTVYLIWEGFKYLAIPLVKLLLVFIAISAAPLFIFSVQSVFDQSKTTEGVPIDELSIETIESIFKGLGLELTDEQRDQLEAQRNEDGTWAPIAPPADELSGDLIRTGADTQTGTATDTEVVTDHNTTAQDTQQDSTNNTSTAEPASNNSTADTTTQTENRLGPSIIVNGTIFTGCTTVSQSGDHTAHSEDSGQSITAVLECNSPNTQNGLETSGDAPTSTSAADNTSQSTETESPGITEQVTTDNINLFIQTEAGTTTALACSPTIIEPIPANPTESSASGSIIYACAAVFRGE